MSLFEGLLNNLLQEDADVEEDEVVEIKEEELETPSDVGDDLEVDTHDTNINDVDQIEQELKDDEDIDINDIDDPDFDEMIDADDEDDEDECFEEDMLDEACDDVILTHAKTIDEEIDSLLEEVLNEEDSDEDEEVFEEEDDVDPSETEEPLDEDFSFDGIF